MQNTMVKNKEVWGKNEEGERKREKNYLKNGKKASKMNMFGLYTPKMSTLRPARRKLIRRRKIISKELGGGGGGGDDRNAQNISLGLSKNKMA